MELRIRRSILPALTGALLVALAGEGAEGQSFSGIPGWRYAPVAAPFMSSVDEAVASGNESRVFKLALERRDKSRGSSEEGEARMVLAQACQRQGLKYCAFHFALSTARDFPGSAPALWALGILEQSLRESEIVESEIRRLMNSGAFKEIPETLLPMSAYFVAVDNIEKDLLDWVPASVKLLPPGNHWRLRWDYLTTLERTRRGSADQGAKSLEELLEQAGGEPRLQALIRFQLARLKFELSDYQAALRLYSQIAPEGRMGGRALYERAWIHFYRGEYAETLGLLHSLKAPLYVATQDPEQYLLEMLTYRKLCHFEAVKGPAAEFRDRYQSVIEQIRQRAALTDNATLVRLSLVKSSLAPEAETVTMIRDERERVEKNRGALPEPMAQELLKVYAKAEDELRERLEIALKKDAPKEAERLLSLMDQIQLVDYLSGLDAYRLQQGFDKRDYQSATGDTADFRTLFWPVRPGEYWHDELKNYRVLVNDKCSSGGR